MQLQIVGNYLQPEQNSYLSSGDKQHFHPSWADAYKQPKVPLPDDSGEEMNFLGRAEIEVNQFPIWVNSMAPNNINLDKLLTVPPGCLQSPSWR